MTETRHITVTQVLLVLFRILFTVFALYTVYFIFRNSLEAGAVSSLRSNEATGTINHILTALGMKPLTTAVVRSWAFGLPSVSGSIPGTTSATSAGRCCWACSLPTLTS